MRHTEFWQRMDAALGATYARSWAKQVVLSELGQQTAQEALDAGEHPKRVWAAVWSTLDLPERDR